MDPTDFLTEELAGLDWKQPKEVQASAKESIRRKIGDDLSPLMIQNLRKTQWENAAEILEGLEPSKVVQFVPDLLEWLKDMNWPGADRVKKICLNFEKHELLPDIDAKISKAREDTDEDWVEALLSLQREVKDRAN
ncbi:DUF5071 domain-containing protein [Roseibium album]|uniref:DUF5071 domain-containing protein n=1 Tax=Roseibium album TaxID=311410 RepID=A0A0M6ZH40_9HYPH|nr:DUF5071 domain-containing protein [Roseibium album]CTQ62089.1 hypothetical protein LA5094_04873 [Roseibium album]CTQ78482.1 hypothetical protein LA5096_05657 [Roseibium album]CTQ79854.1 hypothetical protein LA5095_05082 [Roseibium album]